MTDADYADHPMLMTYLAKTESQLQSLEQAAKYSGLYANTNKAEYIFVLKEKEPPAFLKGSCKNLLISLQTSAATSPLLNVMSLFA